MSNEVELYSKIHNPLDAIETFGAIFANSGLFGCEKLEQGKLLAIACMVERKNPIEILNTYHLVSGRLTMRSDAMLAKFRQAGGKVKWIKSDHTEAIGIWSFEGIDTEIGYTIDDARRAGLVREKSGWQKDPGAMLRARCTSKAVRMLAPEVTRADPGTSRTTRFT